MAAQILATQDEELASRIAAWRQQQTQVVLDNPDPGGE